MELYSDSASPFSPDQNVEVFLDGAALTLPPHLRSLASIRFYLEIIALEQHKVLACMRVDDAELDLNAPMMPPLPFVRVEAETLNLEQMPIQLLETALTQVMLARSRLISSIALVIINEGEQARQIWWSLACELKHPLVTLNLLPEAIWRPASGCVSLLQIRKWQLQQLAAIMKEVDAAAWSDDSIALSNALEKRVVPWLAALERTLDLWHKTLVFSPQITSAPPHLPAT